MFAANAISTKPAAATRGLDSKSAIESQAEPSTPVSQIIETFAPAAMTSPPPEARVADASPASEFDCLIEPYYLVDIGSSVEGVIERMHVERGDSIEAGQVLVELESSVERAAVAVAQGRADMKSLVESQEARLELGEQRMERAEQLHAGDALSKDRNDEARTEAIIARLELEQSREKMKLASLELDHAVARLERRKIKSPLEGIVVERLMSPGEVVDDETVLRLAQVDPLRVQVVLPAAVFGEFEVGMSARIQPELPGAPEQRAEVVLVDRVIDAASGTFGVQLELSNEHEAIPGGLHCRVRFVGE
jgi:RND family efflux transporter MFP subunit